MMQKESEDIFSLSLELHPRKATSLLGPLRLQQWHPASHRAGEPRWCRYLILQPARVSALALAILRLHGRSYFGSILLLRCKASNATVKVVPIKYDRVRAWGCVAVTLGMCCGEYSISSIQIVVRRFGRGGRTMAARGTWADTSFWAIAATDTMLVYALVLGYCLQSTLYIRQWF